MMPKDWKRAAGLCAMAGAIALLTGCGTTMAGGDAGCVAYEEGRLSMPPADTVPGGAWGGWIADTDDRMTGTCR